MIVEPFLTTQQVAELANYAPRTIRKKVKNGTCPCVNPEGRAPYRFRPQEIYAWLDRGMKPDLPEPKKKKRGKKRVLQTWYQ